MNNSAALKAASPGRNLPGGTNSIRLCTRRYAMTEARLTWSIWQALLNAYAGCFPRFAEWITAMALNVEEHDVLGEARPVGDLLDQSLGPPRPDGELLEESEAVLQQGRVVELRCPARCLPNRDAMAPALLFRSTGLDLHRHLKISVLARLDLSPYAAIM
jgi:hypothetical protein